MRSALILVRSENFNAMTCSADGSSARANAGIISANSPLTIHSTRAMSCPARCSDRASTRNAASGPSVHPRVHAATIIPVHQRMDDRVIALIDSRADLFVAFHFCRIIYERRASAFPAIDRHRVNCRSIHGRSLAVTFLIRLVGSVRLGCNLKRDPFCDSVSSANRRWSCTWLAVVSSLV